VVNSTGKISGPVMYCAVIRDNRTWQPDSPQITTTAA
jgi:hypothetical protein